MPDYYSLSMTILDTAPLDGVSPLPANAKVQRVRPGIVSVEVPVGSPYGLFDPGELTGRQNNDFLVVACSVLSDGVPVHAAGSELRLVSPNLPLGPKEQLLQSLANVPGMFPDFARIIPIDHKIALDTIADGPAPGPHRIEWTLITLDATNAGAIAAQVAIAGGSSSSLTSGLLFSAAVQSVAGIASPPIGVIQRYDATALAPGDITIQAPSAPALNDRFGVKEVGNSPIAVTIDGNGSLIESPGLPPAATYPLSTARASLIFQYDGAAWRIV